MNKRIIDGELGEQEKTKKIKLSDIDANDVGNLFEDSFNYNEIDDYNPGDIFDTSFSINCLDTAFIEGSDIEEENTSPDQDQGCAFCDYKLRWLKQHLNNSPACKSLYASKYSLVEPIDTQIIINKRIQDKRKNRPTKSRKPERRSLECKTDKSRINHFFNDLFKFNEIYRCAHCNKLNAKHDVENIPFEINTDYTSTMREGSAYRCKKSCLKDTQNETEFKLYSKVYNGVVIHYANPNNALPNENQNMQEKNITMLPTQITPTLFGKKMPKHQQGLLNSLKKGEIYLSNFFDRCYEQVFHQIEKRKISTIFKGKLVSGRDQNINVFPIKTSLSKLKGTQDFYRRLKNELNFSLATFGPVCLSLTCYIKEDLPELVARVLKVNNENQIDIVPEKNEGLIENIQIKIHSHNDNTLCGPNCDLLSIEEFIEENPQYKENIQKYLPITNNHIQKYYRNIVEIVTKTLGSAVKYYSTISFQEHQPCVKLLLWPESFKNINQKLSQKTPISFTDIEDLTNATSSMITSNQASYNSEDQNFIADQNAKFVMPSNYTLVCEEAIFKEDLSIADLSFIYYKYLAVKLGFKNYIDEYLSKNNKKNISLDQLFQIIQNDEECYFQKSEKETKVKLSTTQEIIVRNDEVLEEYLKHQTLISAIYHRSLSMKNSNVPSIIQFRENILDMYCKTYMPLLSTLKIDHHVQMSCDQTFVNSAVSEPRKYLFPSQLSDYSENFSLVDMKEAEWIVNPKRKYINKNFKIIFVDLSSSTLNIYKRLYADSAMAYTDERTQKKYQKIDDLYDLYLKRIDCKSMCFYEFLQMYDKTFSSNNEDEEDLTKSTVVERFVTTLDRPGIQQEEKLPYILKTEGGANLIRSKFAEKVICFRAFPKSTLDYKLSMVKLFYAHCNDLNQCDEFEIGYLFARPFNNDKTVVEALREKVATTYNIDVWDSFFCNEIDIDYDYDF